MSTLSDDDMKALQVILINVLGNIENDGNISCKESWYYCDKPLQFTKDLQLK